MNEAIVWPASYVGQSPVQKVSPPTTMETPSFENASETVPSLQTYRFSQDFVCIKESDFQLESPGCK